LILSKQSQNTPRLVAGMNASHGEGDVRGSGTSPFPDKPLAEFE
jgi:hypothetical protein